MNIKVPNRSAGICQNYEDYSRIDNLAYAARTTGLKGNELNFTLLKQGSLMNGSELQHGLGRTDQFNPQAGAYGIDPRGKVVPVPHPVPKQRDDLEPEITNRNRPRPY